jgi:hypothetical protein
MKLLFLALAVVGTSATSQAVVRTESNAAVHSADTFFASHEAPKCFVDNGRTVVHYASALHTGSFSCNKSEDGSTCTCTWNHPTHHFGGCKDIDGMQLLGDCSDAGKDMNVFEASTANKFCSGTYDHHSTECKGASCTQEMCLQEGARYGGVTSVLYRKDPTSDSSPCRFSTKCSPVGATDGADGASTWKVFFLKAVVPMVPKPSGMMCNGEYTATGEGYASTACTGASCTEEACLAEGKADPSVMSVIFGDPSTDNYPCRFSYICTEGRAGDGLGPWKAFFRQWQPDRRDQTTPMVKHKANKFCSGTYNSGGGGFFSTTCTGASCTEQACVDEGTADSSVMSIIYDAADPNAVCRFSRSCTAATADSGSLSGNWRSYFRENGPFVEDLQKKFCSGSYWGSMGHLSTECVGASCTLEKCLAEGQRLTREFSGAPTTVTSVIFSQGDSSHHSGSPCRFSFSCTKHSASHGDSNSLWATYHRST